MTPMAWWALAGMGLGVVFAWRARGLGGRRSQRLFALALVVAALVYLVPATLAGEALDVVRATAGVAVFLGFAACGEWLGSSWLAIGWTLHVAWDGALHWTAPHVAPGWYAALCLGFDLVVAGAILIASRSRMRPVLQSREEVPVR